MANKIRQTYDALKPIRHKDWLEDAWIKKHSECKSIDESYKVYENDTILFNFDENPEEWEIWHEDAPLFSPNPDTIVQSVQADLQARSERGMAKYGTTLDRTDLTQKEWLQHAYEEALDFALYLKKLINHDN